MHWVPLQHPAHDVAVHAQAPETQAKPAPQTLPQLPQWLLSDCSSTHALPHKVYLWLHAIPQLFPLHVAVPNELPFDGQGQATLHEAPQLLSDVLLSHVPPQSCVPAGHMQAPFWQVVPPAHACAAPQPPQLLGSVSSSTHAPLHEV